MLAATFKEMKQYDKGIAAINRAIEIKPSDFPYGVLRSIYEEQGKLEEAIGAGKKAIELNPKNISHYFILSNIYLKKEDYASSITVLQKAQELAPNNYSTHFALGDTYDRMGKFNEAIASLSKAIALHTTPCLLTNFGLFAIQGDYPTVIGTIRGADLKDGDKIIKINGESAKGLGLNKINQILQEAKEGQITVNIERKGMEKTWERKFLIQKEKIQNGESVNRHAAGPLGKRSLIYALKGDLEIENKDAKKAYSLDPNNGIAKSAISYVNIISSDALTKENKIDEALKILATEKTAHLIVCLRPLLMQRWAILKRQQKYTPRFRKSIYYRKISSAESLRMLVLSL
ncbi:MAG: tetratricopeptide repeat protein [Thermodesulfobacteriota bacterium]